MIYWVYENKLHDAPFRIYNLLKVMWPWFDHESLSKVKLIVHRWLLICVSNKLWPERALLIKYSPLKTQWPWFALSISSKVKCYTCNKVNWKAIYDLLYVFHKTSIIWCTIYETQPLERYVTLIWPMKVIQGQRSQGQLKDHIWLCICASHKHWSQHVPFLRYWPK